VVSEPTHLGNGKIAVVEGSSVQLNKHIVLAELGDLGLLGHEAVKALLTAGDDPLLLCLGDRHICVFGNELCDRIWKINWVSREKIRYFVS